MSTARPKRVAPPSAKQRQINELQAAEAQAQLVKAKKHAPKPPPGTRGSFMSRPMAPQQTPSQTSAKGKASTPQTLNQNLRARVAAAPASSIRPNEASRPPMSSPQHSRVMQPLPSRGKAQPVPAPCANAKPLSTTSQLRDRFRTFSVTRGLGNGSANHPRAISPAEDNPAVEAQPFIAHRPDTPGSHERGDHEQSEPGEPPADGNPEDEDEYPEEDEAMVYNPADYPYEENAQREDMEADDPEPDEPECVAPGGGLKRCRSPTTEAADSIQRPAQCRRLVHHAGRARQKDFDDVAQQVIKTASELYECTLSTRNAFPDRGTEIDMAHDAWHEACEREDLNLRISPELVLLLTRQGSHLRGEVKTKARPFVLSMYGFSSSKGKKQIAQNRRIVEALQDKGAYKFRGASGENPVVKPEDVYKHACIQEIFNEVWFSNRRASGIVYAEYFEDSIAPLALIVTAIKHCIDEWETGSHATDKHFTEREYAAVYHNNIMDLNDYHNLTVHNKTNVLSKIIEKLVRNGRNHAGVGALEDAEAEDRISRSVFEEAAAAYAAGAAEESSDDDMDN